MTLFSSRVLIAVLMAFPAALTARPAQTLHDFRGQGDGGDPAGGLVADADGNLYGAGCQQGETENGTIYRLSPPAPGRAKWRFTRLYAFTNPMRGVMPCGTLFRRADGALFGTAESGGAGDAGTAFELDPPAHPDGAWTETTLHSFGFGPQDGATPEGSLVADSQGRLFGTTLQGGKGCAQDLGCGVVFMLTPPGQNANGWTETVIHFFDGRTGKAGFPAVDLALTGSDTLYGTTPDAVFDVTETRDGGWRYTALPISPALPTGISAGVAIGDDGTLYGVTELGGANDTGTVFALSPPSVRGASWTSALIHQFGPFTGNKDGWNPANLLVTGPHGVLLGTVGTGGPNGSGVVFRMDSPAQPGGAWMFRTISGLSPPHQEGPVFPAAPVLLLKGQAYFTTLFGGHADVGTVAAIKP